MKKKPLGIANVLSALDIAPPSLLSSNHIRLQSVQKVGLGDICVATSTPSPTKSKGSDHGQSEREPE
ncbi:hypothetical protein LIER_28832 [Lithospermum erythrorhizon]|uniref:Uncharacterized protein n=1 Tax=Lithospermum erythrorhizon TaxID=34254 RepID=A0AAV3RK97_LITER